jgi:integrase/recombinase XerD
VTTSDVAGYLAGLREGDEQHKPLAASSAGRAVVAVRGLHAFALAEHLAGSDPARSVRPPAPPRRLPRAVSIPDVERLLQVAGDSPAQRRDRALLELLYGTGARISEAVGLDVDDLDLPRPAAPRAEHDAAVATVRLAGKGGRERLVPVGSYALGALQAYLVQARPALAASARSGQPSPAVFLNARGGRLTRQGAWGALRAAAARAGLAEVSPHMLRHSFATHLLDGGADVRVVQELLGHASVTTTQVYTLVTVDKLREVYAASHPRALG